MSAKWIKRIAIVAIAGLVSAGAVMAQAPDQEPGGRGQQAPRGGRGGGPRMNMQQRHAMRAGMELVGLLGHEGATIENTEAGIDVTITTDEDVQELQNEVQENLDEFLKAIAEMPARQPEGDRPAFLPFQLMHGEATVTMENVENGVVLSFDSKDPEVVQQIQEGAPQMQERAARMRQMRQQWQTRQQAHEILSQENVTIQTVKTDGGVVVTVTSDDPETQAKLQELLPEFFKGMGEMRRNRERDGDRAGRDRQGDRPRRGRDEGEGDRRGRGRRRDGGGAAEEEADEG